VAQPVVEARSRRRTQVAGVLVAVTYRPSGVPVGLVARLHDGTGELDLVWLGRRSIPGITPGRRLVAEGVVYSGDQRPTIFNPAYRLLREDT